METISDHSDVYLRKRGIKASHQRVSIFDFLKQTTEHPSVSKIFSELHPTIPNLSRATVYNTINLFLEKHIVIPVQVAGEARYDLADPNHAHFHCESCQAIYDISIERLGVPEALNDFVVLESQVHYRGICPKCRPR